jgi:serine/threonine-protein kinase
VLGRIARVDLAPATEVCEGYPPALADIVARALAKAPADRFATAEQMLQAIEAFASAHGVRISTRELAQYMRNVFGSPPHPRTDARRSASLSPRAARRRTWIAGTVIAAGIGAFALWPRASSPSPEPPPGTPSTALPPSLGASALTLPSAHAIELAPARAPIVTTPAPTPTDVAVPKRASKTARRRADKRIDKPDTAPRDALYPPGHEP